MRSSLLLNSCRLLVYILSELSMIYICLFYANFCSSDRLIASARDILLHLLIMEVLAFFNFGRLPILNLFD
jgi:hypothetical protein